LDTVPQKKDEAQAKIYMARMQNASYAGRPQDALQYCDKLATLACDDSLIINMMAGVYYENAKYREAEPLMERHLVIFLEFTRRTGHRHPHLEAAIKNYTALLMQMGHSGNEVNDRLKRLAPEMFESTDKEVKEE